MRKFLFSSRDLLPGGCMPVARLWNLQPENEAWNPAEYNRIFPNRSEEGQ